jgi:branched-chain amino acid transport system ATP-binding protein
MDQLAGDLSGGEQQQLGLAMALIAKPRLLMIDELSLGLSPVVVGQLIEVVRRISDAGTTVIVVEQSVNVALTLARARGLHGEGRGRFSGRPADLLEREDVLRSVFLQGTAAALGTSRRPRRRRRAAAPGERLPQVPALEVQDLSVRFGGIRAVNGVSFSVAPGEVLGIIGPNGAARRRCSTRCGFLEPTGGRISVAARTSRRPRPRAASPRASGAASRTRASSRR